MKLINVITATVALITVGSQANAALMLELSDGTTNNTVQLSDQAFGGSTPDANSLLGAVTYVGGVGSWVLNVTTGTTNPIVGDGRTDVLDLNSINASGGSGTLTVKLTQTDFSKQAGFVTRAGGTTAGNVNFATYLGSNNDPFGMSTLLWESDSMQGAFSDSSSGHIDLTNDPDGLYSLTLVATITHTAAGQNTSFNHEVRVPEPASLALFGIGFLLLGFAARSSNFI